MFPWTPSPRPERRTRGDLALSAGVIVAALALISTTWLLSDARHTNHTAASPGDAISSVSSYDLPVPSTLVETWRQTTDLASTPTLVALDGAVIRTEENRVSALAASDGHEVWSYSRNQELCGVTGSWSRVIAIYRGPKGCGEATSLSVSTGQYVDTRSALAASAVTTFRSLDHVGMLSSDRIELWRSDLVRTVELGHREQAVNPSNDPTQGCSFSSAMTRKSLLAVAMDCPTDAESAGGTQKENNRIVRLFDADPERSEVPEVTHDFTVPSGSELVAIGQDAALIYAPETDEDGNTHSVNSRAVFQVLRTDGSSGEYPAELSPLVSESRTNVPFTAETSDLPHHMTWFDGERLIAFSPSDLNPRFSIPALGTGAAMGGRLLVPVHQGVAVVDWADGHIERVIPVDRGAWEGRVTLRVQGATIIEQRGTDLVGLTG